MRPKRSKPSRGITPRRDEGGEAGSDQSDEGGRATRAAERRGRRGAEVGKVGEAMRSPERWGRRGDEVGEAPRSPKRSEARPPARLLAGHGSLRLARPAQLLPEPMLRKRGPATVSIRGMDMTSSMRE